MINQELVNKIHSLLDKGVTSGLSPDPKPGEIIKILDLLI